MEEHAGRVDRRGPLLFLSGVGLALVVLLVLAVAGVFGDADDVDDEQWRAAVTEQQGQVSDWDAYRSIWVDDICGADEETFTLLVVVAVQGGASLDHIDTNVSYACPDRSNVIDKLRPVLTDLTVACRAGPPRQADERQRMLAEALGCGRFPRGPR